MLYNVKYHQENPLFPVHLTCEKLDYHTSLSINDRPKCNFADNIDLMVSSDKTLRTLSIDSPVGTRGMFA